MAIAVTMGDPAGVGPELILKAFESYREEVSRGEFPTDQHSFHIDEKELSKISS